MQFLRRWSFRTCFATAGVHNPPPDHMAPAQMTTVAQKDRPLRSPGRRTQLDSGVRPVLLVMGALLLFTVSRVHEYLGGLGALRPGLLLLVATLAVAAMSPGAVRLRNLSDTWLSRVMLVIVGWMCVSALFGLSLGGSAAFLLDVMTRVLLLWVLLVVLVSTVTDLKVMFAAYVASLVVLVYIAFFVAGVESYGEYQRLGETAMYDGNDLGVVFMAGFPLALLLVQTGGRLNRVLGWVALLGVPAAIALTASRGGFLALGAGCLALLVLAPGFSWFRKVGVLGMVFAAVAVAAPPGFWGQMGTILNPQDDYNITSETGRMAIWSRGMGYIAEHPVTGVGPDNFVRAGWMISDVARGLSGRGLPDQVPHNTFLQIWAEQGTVGLLLWLGLLVGGVVSCLRLHARMPDSWRKGSGDRQCLFLATRYLPVSVVGFSAGAFFTSHAYTQILYILAAFMASVVLISRRELKTAATGSRTDPEVAPPQSTGFREPDPPVPALPLPTAAGRGLESSR